MDRGLFLGLLLLLGAAGCHQRCRAVSAWPLPPAWAKAYPDRVRHPKRPLAILGDTQRTAAVECLIGREVNDAAQRQLFSALALERPGAVAVVGDLVFNGNSPAHWRFFDHLLAPLRRRGIPIWPALGNHEYWMSNAVTRRYLFRRFPHLRARTWYVRAYGRLRIIVLDSNRSGLGQRFERQRTWYRETLTALDASPDVDGILVLAHHPPYTRSPWVSGNPAVRAQLVPPFLRSQKGLAFISGHAHGYERYMRQGRAFIVTAGGGGPRPQRLKPHEETGLVDRFSGPSPRPLNYLLITPTLRGYRVQAKGLSTGWAGVRVFDTFVLPVSPRPASPRPN